MTSAPSTSPETGSARDQRDRFLAFAFASADLFLEVSGEGRVTFAAGAARSLTGIDEKTLVGKRWIELFSVYDQATLIDLRDKARAGMRSKPMMVSLNDTDLNGRKAVLTAIKMPDNERLYLTLGVGNALMTRITSALSAGKEYALHGRDAFAWAAETLLDQMRGTAQDLNLVLIDFAPVTTLERRFGEAGWEKFLGQAAEILITFSVDGYCVGEIAEGRYAAIMDVKADPALLRDKIAALARTLDPDGKGFAVATGSVAADVKKMTSREISRSVAHVIEQFGGGGVAGVTLKALSAAFTAFLSASEARVKELMGAIERSGFSVHYQPVIDLATGKPAHFEMLTRFETGDARDWFSFALDTGNLAALDNAICERAVNHVKFKSGGTWTKFCVDVSVHSAGNKDFVEKLGERLDRNQNINERLLFSIKQASKLPERDAVLPLIKALKARGFKILLEDISSRFTDLEFLRMAAPDFVKADKALTQSIHAGEREHPVLKKLLERCREMNIGVIAKFIEDERQHQVLKSLGVGFAQGYYYARPGPKADYIPPAA